MGHCRFRLIVPAWPVSKIRFPLMADEGASGAWRPLSRTATLATIDHNGRGADLAAIGAIVRFHPLAEIQTDLRPSNKKGSITPP